ncbi:hypothetical protein AC1031_006121 [Aphanomyces cochlioides]|nr:hypothetical protein AC1031_006121 [Aphanomyces cochlioides]
MQQQRPVERLLRLDVSVNSFRFINKTPEFQIGCRAECATTKELVSVEWVVYKSFEECQVFDTRIRASQAAQYMANIPFAPLYKTKTFFGQAMKPAFLATRQRDLQEYFNRVTSIPGITQFQTREGSLALADFLNVHARLLFEQQPLVDVSRTEDASQLRSLTSNSNVSQPDEPSLGTPRSSDESDEVHLTESQQQELQALIMERISEHAGADVLKAFQKRARRFGKAVDAIDVEGASFYSFMVESFGVEFCQWLVPSLATLLPDKRKRQALTAAMTSTSPQSIDAIASNRSMTRSSSRVRPASEAAIPSTRMTRPQRSRPQSANYINAKEVMAKVRDLVGDDEERVEEFRFMTKELRARRTSAAEYSEYVVNTFGTDVSKDVLVSVAGAMADNQIQEDLHAASEHVHSLRGSIQRQRSYARRKSLDRLSQSSFKSQSSLRSRGYSIDEEEGYVPSHGSGGHTSVEEEPAQDNKILSRLRNQGAVNLMSFK